MDICGSRETGANDDRATRNTYHHDDTNDRHWCIAVAIRKTHPQRHVMWWENHITWKFIKGCNCKRCYDERKRKQAETVERKS